VLANAKSELWGEVSQTLNISREISFHQGNLLSDAAGLTLVYRP
jgi:hypothetical protein